jgi:hypothetical protein
LVDSQKILELQSMQQIANTLVHVKSASCSTASNASEVNATVGSDRLISAVRGGALRSAFSRAWDYSLSKGLLVTRLAVTDLVVMAGTSIKALVGAVNVQARVSIGATAGCSSIAAFCFGSGG